MSDIKKTKAQLLDELGEIRQRVAVLEKADSEHRRVEEDLRKQNEELQLIFDSVPAFIFYKDEEGRIIRGNAAVARAAKVPQEQWEGKTVFELIPGMAQSYHEDDMEVISSGKPKKNIIEPFETSKGVRWLQTHKLPVKDKEGNVTGLIGFSVDISERVKTEEALRENEEKLRTVFDSIRDAVSVADLEGKVVEVNDAAVRLGGYKSKKEILGCSGFDFIVEEDKPKAIEGVKKLFKKGQTAPIEYGFRRKDGTVFDAEASAAVLHDASGNAVGFVSVVRDVSEQRRMEAALRKSEENYRMLAESTKDAIYSTDADGRITYIGPQVSRYGISPDEIVNHDMLDFIYPDDREKVLRDYERTISTGDEFPTEFRITDGEGNIYWIEEHGTVRRGADGEIIGITGVLRDITDRKRAEEAAGVSEQRYRELIEQVKDVVFSVDGMGTITILNSAVRQWGYEPEELMGTNFLDLIPKDWQERTAVELQNALLSAGELVAETWIVDKDGNRCPIEYSATVRHEGGEYVGAQGVVRNIAERKRIEEELEEHRQHLEKLVDERTIEISVANVKLHEEVTQRKRIEAELRDSESRFRELFQHMSSGVVVYEATKDGEDFIFKDFNAAAERISKLRKRDFVGKSVLKAMPGLKDYGLFEVLQTVWKTGKPVHFPASYFIDERVAGWRDNYVYRLPSGEVVAVYDDITDRVESERALRESEEKLRTMFESMMEGVLVTDLEGTIVEMNNSAAEMARSSREELIGRSVFEYIAEEHRGPAAEELAKALSEGTTRKELEYAFVAADGTRIEAEFSASLLCDSEGNPAGIIGIARDITERKRMEDALRESEQKLRTMFESVGDAITVTDLEGRVTDLNQAAVRVFGVKSKKAVIGQEGFKFIAEKDHARTMDDMVKLFEQESRGPVEYTFRKASGEEFEVESSNAVLRDAAGNPTGFVSINRDITERKRMEQALRDSEEKLRAIFDAISDGIAVTDLEINIVQANEAVTRMAGYKKKEQLLGKNAMEWIAPEDIEKAMAPMAEAVKGRPIEREEFRIRPPKGKEFMGEIGISPLRDSAGNMTGFVTVIRDVTERKRMERDLRESEEKLRTIFENIPDGVTITDMEGRIVEENPAGLRMAGCSRREDVIGLNGFDFMVEEDREKAIANMSVIYDTGLGIPGEYRMRTADGLEYDAEIISAMMRDAEGQPSGIVAVIRDITERKRSDEVLRQSEEKYRSLVDHMQEGYLIVRGQHIVFANERCTEFLGIPLDRIVGQSIWDFILPEDAHKVDELVDAFTAGRGEMHLMEFGYYREDGRMVPLEINLKGIEYEGKTALSVVLRDVTERKQMEKELRESEEKLRTMFETMREGVILVDMEGTIVDLNEATLRIGGHRSKKELIGKNGFDLVAEKDRERMLKDFANGVAGTGSASHWEVTLVRGNGTEFEADMSAAMLRDSIGNPMGFIGVIRDITERKRMEEELLRISIAVESSSDAIGMSDPQGRHFYQNRAFTELFEYTPQELDAAGGGPAAYADKDVAREVFDTIMSGGSWSGEVEMMSKSGRMFPVLLRADAVKDDSGNIIGLVGVHTDITEQKRSQEALRDSEEKLRFMFASITDAVVVVDLDGKVIEVNDAGLRLTGYGDKEELIGQSAFDFMVDEDRERAIGDMAKSFETGPGFLVQYRLRNRQGGVSEVEAAGGMLLDSAGNVTGFINVVRDITQSKRMEEALRASEEKLRFMFSSIIDAVVVVDLEGKVLEVNDAGLRLTGYSSKEELVGISAFEFIAEEDRERAVNDMLKSFEVGPGFEVQYRFRNKQGDLFYVEARGGMLYDASGEITGHIVIVRDITERQRMEQALRESEEKLRNVFESTSEGMAVTDMNGEILEINEAAVRMHGYQSKEELIGRSSLELISERDRDRVANEAVEAVKQGLGGYRGEYVLVKADGTEFEAEYGGALMYDASGNPIGYVGVSRDVTERKRAEAALRESEEKLRAIFEAIVDGVTVTDMEGTIVQQNEATRRMLGYGRKDILIGKSGMEIISEKDLKRAVKYMEKVVKRGRGGTIEYSLRTKDGSMIDAEVRASALRDNEGNPVGIVGVARDITERKRMVQALSESEEKLRAIFESIADAILVIGMDGDIQDANAEAVRMLGRRSKEEVVGTRSWEYLLDSDRGRSKEYAEQMLKEGFGGAIELRLKDPDGNNIDVESRATVLRDSDGKPIGLVGVSRDITERKRMQEELKNSEEKLRFMFESIADGIISVDLEGKITEVNEAIVRMSGYSSKEELIGLNAFDFVAERDRDRALEENLKNIAEGHGSAVQYVAMDKDGNEFTAESVGSMLLDNNGNPIGFITVIRDVTERQRMEQALRESEEKLRSIFETSPDFIMSIARDGTLLFINRTVPEMTIEQAVGTCAYDYIMPEARDSYIKAIDHVFETAEPMTFETSGLGPDGRTSYYEARLAPVMGDSEVISVTTVATDITERRRAEEAVRESEERYRTLVEGAGTAITMFDTEGRVLLINELSADYFGGTPKDFIGKTMQDLFPDVGSALLERNERIIKTGIAEEYEDLLDLPTGQKWFLSSLQPVVHPDGTIYAVQVISYDITDRKHMEEVLRDSEEKLRFMFESMGDAIVVVDMEGRITELNDQLLAMSGYESREEVLGMNAFDFVAERDRAEAMQTFARNMEQEINATVEYRSVDKYGREFDVEANGSMLNDDEGNAVGFIIALRDVSERKIMEQKLKDSEELARGMLESAATGIYMVQDGMFEYVSPLFVEISGYTEDELLGTEALSYVHPDDIDEVREKAVESLKGGSGLPHEFRFVRKDGTNVWVLEKVASIEYKGRRATIASFMDITELKRAEQAVKESEEKLRSFMDSATDFFTIWDSGLNLVDLNEAALKYPLYDIPGVILKERAIGKNMAVLDPGVKQEGRYEQFMEVIRTGKPFFTEDIVKHPRLGEFHMAVSAFKAGEGLGIIASDVTERRRAEEELKHRKDELEKRANQLLALQKVTTSIQLSLELDEVLQQVAEGVVDNLGYDQSFILVVDEKTDVYRGRTSYSKRPEEFREGVQEIIGMQLSDVVLPRRKGFVAGLDASMDGRLVITPKFSELAEPMLDKKQANAVQKLLGAKTVISMPLFAMDRHVGGIIAFTTRAEVTESDVEPLRLLADQVGIAIVNARAYEVTAEMAQRLSVTSTLSRILGSSLDINEVYQTFTEEIRNVIGFELANIALVEGDRLRLVSLSPESKGGPREEELLPLAGSVTEWAIEHKQTNIEPDFAVEKRFPLDEVYASEGLRSAIRVPLFSKGEAFGSFELVSREPDVYGEREQGILEQVAGSIATAVENSRLFTQVKEHEAELIKAYDDLKTAQEYMLQAEKLRALGEMAGGVAHDFNNVLAIILGRAQLALEDVKDDKLKRDLQIIEQTAIDAASTVRRLQDFARVRVDRTFGAVDLNKLVEGALEMVESRRIELKETAGVAISIKADMEKLPPVSGDTAELREALVNIIFNAMDAMPEGGRITIKGVQEDGWVVLSVKDTGVGMPEDVRGRIFDPFFTTRSPKGSGLGLSVTYSIITRHGGIVEVESEVGKGATFFIRLPVAVEAIQEGREERKPVSLKSATILLVDDDPEVSEVLGLMLKQMGHKVVSVNTGEAAVNTFEVGDYDLVITDLGMPDMSGNEVATAVKDIKPGTPVVLITGWGVQLDPKEMPEIDGVVAKPFSKGSLLEQIADLLPGKGGKKKQQKRKGPK